MSAVSRRFAGIIEMTGEHSSRPASKALILSELSASAWLKVLCVVDNRVDFVRFDRLNDTVGVLRHASAVGPRPAAPSC